MGCYNYLKIDDPKEIEEKYRELIQIIYQFLDSAKNVLFWLQLLMENMFFPVHADSSTWKVFLPFFIYSILTHISMLRVGANSGSLSHYSREVTMAPKEPLSSCLKC